MRRRARIVVIACGGLVGGLLAWQVPRGGTATERTGSETSARDASRSGTAEVRHATPVKRGEPPARATPDRVATGGDRPLLRRETSAAPVDWDDPQRDPAWAPAMERTLHDVAAPRLAEDFPGTRWLGTECRTRTCSLRFEVPAADAADFTEYLGGLVQVDDVVLRPRTDEATDETTDGDAVHVVLDLRLPEDRMSPRRFADEQARIDATYPHIRARQRAWLEHLRAERAPSR